MTTTWTISTLTDDGHGVRFVAEFLPGGPVDFLIDAPTGRPIVTDAMGRHRTESGRWLIPAVEVGGEWVARPEDPADPWARHPATRDVDAAIERACAAHARRLEAHRAGA